MTRALLTAAFAATAIFSGAPASAQEPRRGGTLTYAVLGDPPTLDCHAASSFATMHYVSPHYSLLIRIDPNDPSKVAPDIATSWSEAPDRLAYTFKLQPGVLFHDGTPLTSADVKASFERMRNPPEGIVSIRKSQFSRIAAIEAPDPATVVFRLRTPSPAFLVALASPFNCLYSAVRLAQNANYPATEVMGSGPFQFVERVPGSHWVAKRFDGYFGKPRPYLDGFRAVNIAPQALATALQSGQVMTQFRTLSPAIRDRLQAAMGEAIDVHTGVYDFLVVVAFNTRKKPFDDVRVRRALSLAIDRRAGAEALAKVSSLAVVGATQRPGSPWAASESEIAALPGFGTDIAAARAEARRLLKEAGHESLTLKLVNRNIADPYTSAGIYLVDQWRQIGITTEHAQVDVKTLTNAMRSGEFDAIVDFHGEGVDDPSIVFARNVSADVSSYNPSGFIDRTIDDLFVRIDREFDPSARKALVREFERRLLTEAYQVPFLWLKRTVTMPRKLRGFIMTPSHFLNQDLGGLWLAD
ncbi:MAG: ABC transporter substrate-binding protein [Hyphomicrobiaceae bacterium]